MKRVLTVLLTAVLAFGSGVLVYDLRSPNFADAGQIVTSTTAVSTLASPAVGGVLGLSGTLGVSGAVSFDSTLVCTGRATFGPVGVTGTLGVSGAAAFSGAVTMAPDAGVALTVTGVSGVTGLWIKPTTQGYGLHISGVAGSTGQKIDVAGIGTGLWVTGGSTSGTALVTSGTSGDAIKTTGNANGYGIFATGNSAHWAAGFTASGSSGGGALITTTAGGIGVRIDSDLTSPASPHMRLSPGDTNPATCTIGDLFMFTGGVLRVCTATNTWTNVGAQ